jgi:hypothetical protein
MAGADATAQDSTRQPARRASRRRRVQPDPPTGRQLDLSGYVQVGVDRYQPRSMRAAEAWKRKMASE